MVCTYVNELKPFLLAGSCTTLMTCSFVTQPASSTSCEHYTRRRHIGGREWPWAARLARTD